MPTKGIECWFLGYAFGIKGYRLENKQTKSIIISWNVVFREHYSENLYNQKKNYDKINTNSNDDLKFSKHFTPYSNYNPLLIQPHEPFIQPLQEPIVQQVSLPNPPNLARDHLLLVSCIWNDGFRLYY